LVRDNVWRMGRPCIEPYQHNLYRPHGEERREATRLEQRKSGLPDLRTLHAPFALPLDLTIILCL